ncbi:MAG: UDP-2,4-diacetamido-2,4,6-trideoxy-beta-L-altropyranose hydrolase [Microthrixaceae bacterium]|nr:UDP-2,4-diacetamido-2,4,6-trideoxy-beta-L-altropyranose hydrolase [Microthrixaceae bacterium]
MIGHLVVLPDHRTAAGAGHLARCLSLAGAWIRAGGSADAPLLDAAPLWASRYVDAGLRSCDEPPAWTVLDDYRADTDVQRRHRDDGVGRLAVIDDHGLLAPYEADLVIDQNIGAAVAPPSAAGCRYAMLRPEFAAARRRGIRDVADRARTVVVSLGGSPSAATKSFAGRVVDLLLSRGFNVDVLSGATDVAERMLAADIALAASGSTAYELACVGTPAILMSVAQNQEPVGNRLAGAGAAQYLGRVDELEPTQVAAVIDQLAGDATTRRALAGTGRRLIDGRGADRAVARLRSIELQLDDAGPADAERYWQWANDADVRAASFHPDPIPWDDHQRWFRSRVESADSLLFVARSGGDPIGQIRFDRDGDRAVIAFSLDRAARGAGLGAPLLLAGLDAMRSRWPGSRAIGVVRSNNIASRRSFELAGFDTARQPTDEIVEYHDAGVGA